MTAKINGISDSMRVWNPRFGEGTVVDVSGSIATIIFKLGPVQRMPIEMLNSSRFGTFIFEKNNKISIERIKIEKLFGSIDKDMYIDTSNCVAVLSDPNGCGKTTTFKLLAFALSPSITTFNNICTIPFDTFSCYLSNGKIISFTRLKELDLKEKKSKSFDRRIVNEFASRVLKDAFDFCYDINDGSNNIESIGLRDSILNSRTERSIFPIDDYELDDEFFRDRADMRLALFINKIHEALIKYGCRTSIDFIEANRLQKSYSSISASARRSAKTEHGFDNYYSPNRKTPEPERVDYLALANDEMTTNIGRWLQEYNRRLTDAKNRLPALYIQAKEVEDKDFDSFKKRWNDYHNELKKFSDIGILDSQEAVISSDELEKAFEEKSSFLMTYLKAFEETLAPLQENYKKLKLFIDIFNTRNRITNKTIRFTPTGIEVRAGENKIDIGCLSSGEKNDFVMFYRLIFNASKKGIVLIDEPEISLHIEWQEEYLDRLIDICGMNDLQAIVATHSPNIVNSHSNLFIDKR